MSRNHPHAAEPAWSPDAGLRPSGAGQPPRDGGETLPGMRPLAPDILFATDHLPPPE